jgi:hypothetical protein
MRIIVASLFRGATPALALLYVPVPAYVLWIDFKRYSSSPAILLAPALVALIGGYVDRRRGPFHVALWFATATYAVIIVDTVVSAVRGDLHWATVPFVLGGAAAWVTVIIGLPTLLCTALGRYFRAPPLRHR